MSNRAMMIFLIMFMGCVAICHAANNKIKLIVDAKKEIVGNKTYIIGKTNLPPGTKLGVEFNGYNYKAQDFGIIVTDDGSFKSEGFTVSAWEG